MQVRLHSTLCCKSSRNQLPRHVGNYLGGSHLVMGESWSVKVYEVWMVYSTYGVFSCKMCKTCDAAYTHMDIDQEHALKMRLTTNRHDSMTRSARLTAGLAHGLVHLAQ